MPSAAAAFRQRTADLAEPPELEMLGDVQRLRQPYQHALDALGVVHPATGAANGSVTGVGVTMAFVPQLRMAVTLPICVCPWNSLGVPVTRTRSPRLTESLLPLKTKMPSEVAALPSPSRILDEEAADEAGDAPS